MGETGLQAPGPLTLVSTSPDSCTPPCEDGVFPRAENLQIPRASSCKLSVTDGLFPDCLGTTFLPLFIYLFWMIVKAGVAITFHLCPLGVMNRAPHSPPELSSAEVGRDGGGGKTPGPNISPPEMGLWVAYRELLIGPLGSKPRSRPHQGLF